MLAAQGVPAAPPARPPRHRAVEGEPAPRRRCGLLRRSLHEVLHKHLHMLFSNEELTGRCASRVPARHCNVLDGAGRAPGADQALRPRSARPTSSSATANMVMQMVAAAQAERAAAAAAAAAAAESSGDED